MAATVGSSRTLMGRRSTPLFLGSHGETTVQRLCLTSRCRPMMVGIDDKGCAEGHHASHRGEDQ
jgi:hypothetical protein